MGSRRRDGGAAGQDARLVREERLASYFRAAYAGFRATIAWFGQSRPPAGLSSAAALRYYQSRLIEKLGELAGHNDIPAECRPSTLLTASPP